MMELIRRPIRVSVTDTNQLGDSEILLGRSKLRRSFIPEPPPGFVRRSDPNYYFLTRKF